MQKVTCPQTFENKENAHNIISMDNILIWLVCGSGKKYDITIMGVDNMNDDIKELEKRISDIERRHKRVER